MTREGAGVRRGVFGWEFVKSRVTEKRAHGTGNCPNVSVIARYFTDILLNFCRNIFGRFDIEIQKFLPLRCGMTTN